MFSRMEVYNGSAGDHILLLVGYAIDGRAAKKHGNSGSIKPRAYIMQAISILRCILDKLADHMPHRYRTLASSEKVVSKVLSTTWKWKESIPELN
jgi:hypothetical protein